MWNEKITERLLSLPRPQKRLFALIVDAILCLWSVSAALYLRLEEWSWPIGSHWLALIVAPLIALPIFVRCGLYRAIFRYTGWSAMIAVTRACLIYGVVYATFFTFISVPGVPRTIGIIQPVLLFLSVAAVRALAHLLLGGNYRRILSGNALPNVLIYGAGRTGRQLATSIVQSGTMNIVGFLDDDRSLHGASVQGVMIHSPSQLKQLVERHDVEDVLLAVPSASRQRRREVLEELLRVASINVRTLPGLLDLAQGRFEVSELRPVEIEDLLGRDAVAPDSALLERNIAGRVVLVTGGGGSIGSELCRQILELKPARLLIVDSSEYALYAIHSELEARQRAAEQSIPVVPLLASVLNQGRMRAIFSAWQPETVYHAAAYKHVPLVEHNVLDGLNNNVLGTLALASLSREFEVGAFVLISTDKAVRPANVMGASKRVAEMILQAIASEGPSTCFSMVRFGNVLGSSGSVVPLFRQQIKSGGPVTVTHPEVTRYFMTIPEAAQLVIQAGAMAEGGDVFVLDMGEPVKIYELAANMIGLSGLTVRDNTRPDGDIEISIVGLRPGEKLYEELLIGNDPIPTRHQRILRARELFPTFGVLGGHLEKLYGCIESNDAAGAISILQALVPEYAGSRPVDWTMTDAPQESIAAPSPAPAESYRLRPKRSKSLQPGAAAIPIAVPRGQL